jgi:hypothetical protein
MKVVLLRGSLLCALVTIANADRLGIPKVEDDFFNASTWKELTLVHERNLNIQADVKGNNGVPSKSFPLKECQGDCDKDDDCAGSLRCFRRSGQQRVPGCTGTNTRWQGVDFCYDPNKDSARNDPAPTGPSPSPPRAGSRLKLYWENGYRWQGETQERKWCMECDGGSCTNGDLVRIEKCDNFNTQFEFYRRNGDEAGFQDVKSNFCMRLEDKLIKMRRCDSNDELQRFVGSFSSSKFEIKPKTSTRNCLTQQHHPKWGEIIRIYTCDSARDDTTSLWNKY